MSIDLVERLEARAAFAQGTTDAPCADANLLREAAAELRRLQSEREGVRTLLERVDSLVKRIEDETKGWYPDDVADVVCAAMRVRHSLSAPQAQGETNE